jgi:surface protein
MGKHGKKFLNMSDYEAFKVGGDYLVPNVSFIVNDNVVMYGPVKLILSDGIAKLVYSGSGTAQLMSSMFTGMDYIEEMTIDGVQVTPVKSYNFETDGEHTVEIKFSKDMTSMFCMFTMCSGLTSVDMSGVDTSKVENMDSMLGMCTSLTSIDSIKDWDTSSVTNMKMMFAYCSGLTSIDSIKDWDTSSVTNMLGMFAECTSLTSIDCIKDWDTSSVTDMSGTFNDCTGLTSVDLTGWDTSSVTTMNYMFAGCTNLTELRMGGNPSNVTDVSEMFGEISTKGTFYYNSAYDYSNILSALPSTWSALACELVDGVLIPLPQVPL